MADIEIGDPLLNGKAKSWYFGDDESYSAGTSEFPSGWHYVFPSSVGTSSFYIGSSSGTELLGGIARAHSYWAGAATTRIFGTAGQQCIYCFSQTTDHPNAPSASKSCCAIYGVTENNHANAVSLNLAAYGAYFEARATIHNAVGAEIVCQNTSGVTAKQVTPLDPFGNLSSGVMGIALQLASGGTKEHTLAGHAPNQYGEYPSSTAITIWYNENGHAFHSGILFTANCITDLVRADSGDLQIDAIVMPAFYSITWQQATDNVRRLSVRDGALSWWNGTAWGSVYTGGNLSVSGTLGITGNVTLANTKYVFSGTAGTTQVFKVDASNQLDVGANAVAVIIGTSSSAANPIVIKVGGNTKNIQAMAGGDIQAGTLVLVAA